MMRLLYYLPLLLLSACASHHATTTPPVASEPIAAPVAPVDSVVVVPHRSLVEKVLNRTPQADTHVGQLPAKIGKKSTVSVYYGPATVTTVTTGKKAAPVVVADSGAAVHLATSGTGIAQAGAGNTATMPAPTPKPSFWQRFKWPALGLGTIAAIAADVYLWPVLSPGFAWFIALFRRKKETDTTTA